MKNKILRLLPQSSEGRYPLASASRASKLLCAAGAAASLAGCAQNTATTRTIAQGGIDPKYGVAPSPRVVAEGEEVPKGGGRYQVGKAYQIAGKTYAPSERATVSVGSASWYGSDFHGRKTANGEVFDRNSFSAAHPTMPLPSYARITNLRNHYSMVVRVNDRGPYHGGRVTDVSQKVAEALDFKRHGTAKVRVEFLRKAGIYGSDDRLLLATLRTDGAPAALDGQPASAPTMVAEQADPQPRASSAGARRAQAATHVETASQTEDSARASHVAQAAPAYEEEEARAAPATKVAMAYDGRGHGLSFGKNAPLPPIRPSTLKMSRSADSSERDDGDSAE